MPGQRRILHNMRAQILPSFPQWQRGANKMQPPSSSISSPAVCRKVSLDRVTQSLIVILDALFLFLRRWPWPSWSIGLDCCCFDLLLRHICAPSIPMCDRDAIRSPMRVLMHRASTDFTRSSTSERGEHCRRPRAIPVQASAPAAAGLLRACWIGAGQIRRNEHSDSRNRRALSSFSVP